MTANAFAVALDIVEEANQPELATTCRLWLRDDMAAVTMEWARLLVESDAMRGRRKALHLRCEHADMWESQRRMRADGCCWQTHPDEPPYWCPACVASGKLTTKIRTNGTRRGVLLRRIKAHARREPCTNP